MPHPPEGEAPRKKDRGQPGHEKKAKISSFEVLRLMIQNQIESTFLNGLAPAGENDLGVDEPHDSRAPIL